MKIEEVICDQCGARKGKTNHWYHLLLDGEIGFKLFKQDIPGLINTKDICGENCAMKALQEFLDPPKELAKEMLDYIEEQLPQ